MFGASTKVGEGHNAEERTSARSGKRRCKRPSCLGCQALWSGCLNGTKRDLSAHLVFFFILATHPLESGILDALGGEQGRAADRHNLVVIAVNDQGWNVKLQEIF